MSCRLGRAADRTRIGQKRKCVQIVCRRQTCRECFCSEGYPNKDRLCSSQGCTQVQKNAGDFEVHRSPLLDAGWLLISFATFFPTRNGENTAGSNSWNQSFCWSKRINFFRFLIMPADEPNSSSRPLHTRDSARVTSTIWKLCSVHLTPLQCFNGLHISC